MRGNRHYVHLAIMTALSFISMYILMYAIEIAPELTGHGLPLGKCEAYNRVYDQFYQSR
jgi:hypothetical protein